MDCNVLCATYHFLIDLLKIGYGQILTMVTMVLVAKILRFCSIIAADFHCLIKYNCCKLHAGFLYLLRVAVKSLTPLTAVFFKSKDEPTVLSFWCMSTQDLRLPSQ